jgi:hypothetical protein
MLCVHFAIFIGFTVHHSSSVRITIKLDRLIVLSESSLLGWFLHVSLILIIKGEVPKGVSLIVIIKQVSSWLSLIIKLFHNFTPNLSKSAHDSPDQTDDRIKSNRISWIFGKFVSLLKDMMLKSEVKEEVTHRSVHKRHHRTQSVLKKRGPAPSPDAVGGRIALSRTFVAPPFTVEISMWHQVCEVARSKE